MLLGREIANDNHIHRLVIISDADGWDVREEEDDVVVHRAHHTDWQRVEVDVWLFDMKATAFASSKVTEQ